MDSLNNNLNRIDFKAFANLLVIIFLLSILLFPPIYAAGGEEPSQGKPLKSSSHNPKIETRLELISTTANQNGPSAAKALARKSGIPVNISSQIDVVVEEKAGKTISQIEIKNIGGMLLGQTGNLKKVRLPVNRIEALAENLEGVRYVRTPYTPTALDYKPVESNSSYNSRGTNLTGGSIYHANNYLGEGVKVAVIDLGFASLDYAREAEEIPQEAIAETRDYTGSGIGSGTAHGTGVAEIVHDMAPAAKLYLKKIGDEVDLGEATSDAISQGIDVIVHSVGWLNTNFGDGTGVIADITREATSTGILWVNAAGNSARRHWEGTVTDSDGDGWVEFEDGKEKITVKNELNQDIGLYLTWNDWPTTEIDFDLFLYDEEGNLVKSSANHQTGNEPPTEDITHSPSSGNYYLKVSAPEGYTGIEIEIFSLNQALEPALARSSIMAPGNAQDVFTVGAINQNNWVNGPIEAFSSRGPTADGRIKPDLTGIDGVTLYTYRSLLGTSAAAPSVGGAAALILSRSPELGSTQLKKALKKNVKDLGEPGADNTYGAGRMRLIFNSPSISREVENEDNTSISPGEVFTVNSTAKMPLTLQGGLIVEESLPEPLEIKEVVKPGSPEEVGEGKVKIEWPIVEAGTTKEITYRVLVPEDTDPGEYEITGTINGNSTDSTEINVTSAENLEADLEGLVLEEVKAVLDRFSSRTEFKAVGENVYQIRVNVYSLLGKEVFDSDWREGNTFQWNLLDGEGKSVPNGVYLYYVEVKGPDGETERSGLSKTLVLR
ncbi:S8 family serine peptidase [Candidatus Bipolaricaulota bacterium]|nr:S8 family serine peptidase [Candidatus Bipolaricaulota bacterium]